MSSADEHRRRRRTKVFEPVDAARAVWRGLVLVGHRRSVTSGTMFWSLPGNQAADTHRLMTDDPHFHIIAAPSLDDLLYLQQELQEINT